MARHLILVLALALVVGLVMLLLNASEPLDAESSGAVEGSAGAESSLIPVDDEERRVGSTEPEGDSSTDQASTSVAKAERKKVRGTILDARTQQPLPEFRIQIVDRSGRDDGVVTDGEGRFESRELYPPGPLHVYLRDGEGLGHRYGRSRVSFTGEEVTLEVRVGPTYDVVFDPPGGLAPTFFFVHVEGIRSDETRIRPRDLRTRVRISESRLWARLHPWEVNGDRPPAELVLESEDGCWIARAPVNPSPGRHGPITLTFEQTGSLVGRLESTGRDRPALQGKVLVEAGGREHWAASDDEGHFILRGIPAGTHLLRATAPGHEEQRLSIQFEAGQPMHEVLRLSPVVGETLRCEVIVPEEVSVSVYVTCIGEEGYFGTTELTVEKTEAGFVGRGRVPVPSSPSTLYASLSGYTPTPGALGVSPGDEARFEFERSELRTYVVESTEFDNFVFWFRTGSGVGHYAAPIGGESQLSFQLPVEESFRWRIAHPHGRSVAGSHEQFQPSGEQWLLAPRAELGASGCVTFLDALSGNVIPGITVRLDEADLVADEYGVVWFDQPSSPQEIEVLTQGYALSSQTPNLDTGTGVFLDPLGVSTRIYVVRATED